MVDGDMTKAEDFDMAAAKNALEVLILAYEEESWKPTKGTTVTSTPFRAAKDIGIKSPKQIYREDIIERPIMGALRLAIREVGEYLWQNTKSTRAMLDVLEEVASRHPDKESCILGIADGAWDGLGEGGDIWCG